MGLDIWFWKVKHKQVLSRYINLEKKLSDLDDEYYKKYETPLKAASEKWNKWYNEECDKQDEDSNYEFNYNAEPKYELTDFCTKEEADEYNALKKERDYLGSTLCLKYEDRIETLDMRKQNWMVAFVQSRHPELLKHDDNFGYILEQGNAILDKSDIQELIDRMLKILSGWTSYDKATGKPGADNDGWRTEEACEWISNWKPSDSLVEEAKKLLPTMSRFFFGNTEYNYYYFESLDRYYKNFKEVYDSMADDEVLYYNESW